MPRTQKESQGREVEDEERELREAPRVDEDDAAEDERAPQTRRSVEDDESDDEEDEIAQEIDIEDLSAMEGPDA